MSKDYYKAVVTHALESGDILTKEHVQVMLAVLRGDDDGKTLAELLSGFKTKYKIPKHILGYKPIMASERPSGSNTHERNILIAQLFEEYRQHLKADDAYSKLANESKERFGVYLSDSRIKKCVTYGNKFKDIIDLPVFEDEL